MLANETSSHFTFYGLLANYIAACSSRGICACALQPFLCHVFSRPELQQVLSALSAKIFELVSIIIKSCMYQKCGCMYKQILTDLGGYFSHNMCLTNRRHHGLASSLSCRRLQRGGLYSYKQLNCYLTLS